ncbi:MAG: hypothetical protein Q9183_006526 [Haloplaca sp. 2 TL-2023]
MSSEENDLLLYAYNPSRVLPILFAILVSLLGLAHIYQAFIRYKWFRFGLMMLWASSVWITGLICRALSAYSPDNINLYICQYVMILAGPVLYAASEYFILGRLLAYVPYHTPIQPSRVLSTFLFFSAAVEGVTAAGAATVATNTDDTMRMRTGLNLVKAGLLLQAVVELGFLTLVALVEYRCRRTKHFPTNVKVPVYVLYITSIMMLVRCIFRAVEGFQQAECTPENPHCSTVDRYEWMLWVFEVANITVFVIALVIFHPGRYLPHNTRVFLDYFDGKTERLGPGFAKATHRGFLATVVDPFGFASAVREKGERVDRFWEREQPTVNTQKDGDV